MTKDTVSRRDFLKKTGQVGAAFCGLQLTGGALSAKELSHPGYGALMPDPYGIIRLPRGFSYKIISRVGETMSDGYLTPGKPDGMATFPYDKHRILIVRNHEVSATDYDYGPFGYDNELLKKEDIYKIYDYGRGIAPCQGGTTTLLYNLKDQRVERSHLSLGGTIRNCAGGPTPWGSWLTCEENITRADNILQQDHGYVFDVPSRAEGLVKAEPLKAMGRFNHEAAAVDPVTGIVYLTEDRGDSLFYRFIPNVPGKLNQGGRLQALAVTGEYEGADVRNWNGSLEFPMGAVASVRWIDMDNPESPEDDLRHRGFELGATRFARGEGIWFGDNELYFACTNGGVALKGQIFRYRPSPVEGQEGEVQRSGQLDLFIESPDEQVINKCDNLTIAPWGHVIACEDNKHPFVNGITQEGKVYKIAENVGYASEFAGGCFSPDGSTFFVNIQHAGITVAITGPWL